MSLFSDIRYNPSSSSLKSLSLDKKMEIMGYFRDPEELRKRKCSQKFRITHAGQSLTLWGLQAGNGSERGSERVLYTYWNNKIILLEYVKSHDYQKVPSMCRKYFSRFFAEIKKEEERLCTFEEIPVQELLHDEQWGHASWQAVAFDNNGRFIIPSIEQHLVIADKQYPIIIEGPAGSGKTLVLAMICEELSQEFSTQEEPRQVFYLYPNNAILLGKKMQQYWSESYLSGENALPNAHNFYAHPIDDCLPEELKSHQIQKIFIEVEELFRKKKKSLATQKKIKPQAENALLCDPWHTLIQAEVSVTLLTEYMFLLAVFRTYLPSRQPLKHMLSSRDGIFDQIFDAFEKVYEEKISISEWFAPLIEILKSQSPEPFDMLVIDEAQNIPFVALAYLAFHTKDHRVIYSGDRDQAQKWASLSSLSLIEMLLKQSGLATKDSCKQLSGHYRCPAEVWGYTQNTLLPLKEQFFGREYQRQTSFSQYSQGLNHALSYLRVIEKNRDVIQDFFGQIPEMSPDCFIVTPHIERFNKLSTQYLAGKNLIVLTPEQIAGLETKVIIVLDILDFDNIQHLSSTEKLKNRLMKLDPEKEAAYAQFNSLHVTLTRSTESVLILETKNNTRHDIYQKLFGCLLPPIINNQSRYLSSSPEELFKIYNKIMAQSAAAGSDFYERYGHIFEEFVKNNTDEQQPMKSEAQAPIVMTENSIKETIEKIASNLLSWDNLPEYSIETIAALLFTPLPWGKKRNQTKTFFEHLAGQLDTKKTLSYQKQKCKNSSTEEIVWAKFLGSNSYKEFIKQGFDKIKFPSAPFTIEQWFNLCPKTPGYNQLKKDLGVVVFSEELFEQKNSNNKNDSSSIVSSTTSHRGIIISACDYDSLELMHDYLPAPSLNEMLRLCKELSNIIINCEIHDKKQSATLYFYIYTFEYIKYYQNTYDTQDKNAALNKLQEFIEKQCMGQADFWKNFTAQKYESLRERLNNTMLFFNFENNRWKVNKSLIQKAVDSILDDIWPLYQMGMLAQAHANLKQSLDGIIVLLNHYRCYILEQKFPHEDKPLIIMLHEIAPQILDYLPLELLKKYVFEDSFWKNKNTQQKQYDFKRLVSELRVCCNPVNLLKIFKESARLFEISTMKTFEELDSRVDKQLYNIMTNSQHELPTSYPDIQFFISYYAVIPSWPIEEDLRVEFERVIKSYCIYSPDFWINLTHKKYNFLKSITNKRLFWEEWKPSCFEEAVAFSRTALSLFRFRPPHFDGTWLRESLEAIKKQIIMKEETLSRSDIWFNVIKNGVFLVLSDYRNDLKQSNKQWEYYGAPLIILLWRVYPAIANELSKEQFVLLLNQDSYLCSPTDSNRCLWSLLQEVHNGGEYRSYLEQAIVEIHNKFFPLMSLDYPENKEKQEQGNGILRHISNAISAYTNNSGDDKAKFEMECPLPLLLCSQSNKSQNSEKLQR